MIFGIDIDGCLCDTDSAIRRLLATRLGREVERHEITHYHYRDCLPLSPLREMEVFGEWRATMLHEMPVNAGARECLEAMADIGELWIITSRPPESFYATSCWLQANELPHNALVMTHDKTRLAPALSVMVEDCLATAQAMASGGVRTMLFDAPWNKAAARPCSMPLLQRVKSWKEIANGL